MVTGKPRPTFIPVFAAFICHINGEREGLAPEPPRSKKMFLGAVGNIITPPEVYETHYTPYKTSPM